MRNFANRFLALILLAMLSAPVNGQLYEHLSGPYGGGAKMYEGRNGILFQYSGTSSVFYRSLDGGTNWQLASLPTHVTSGVFSVGADGSLFLLFFNEIFKSSDNGLSWGKINLPPLPSVEKITSLSDGTLLCFGDVLIYRSTNNGQLWTLTNFGAGIFVDFHPSQRPGWVFVTTLEEIFLSKDGGQTWSKFYWDYSLGPLVDFAESPKAGFFFSGRDVILHLDSLGKLVVKTTVRKTTNGPVQMTLSTSGWLFAVEHETTHYSNDYGKTWNDFSDQGIDLAHFKYFFSSRSGTVFGIRQNGSLYRSNDNGVNWAFSAFGLQEAWVRELDFLSDREIMARTSDGLFHSSDKGKKWNLLAVLLGNVADDVPRERVAFDERGKTVYYLDATGLYRIDLPGTIPVHITATLFNTKRSFSLHAHPLTSTLFAWDEAGFYRSENAGTQWQDLGMAGIHQVYSFPSGEMIAISESAIMRSVDDGNLWDRIHVFKDKISLSSNLATNGFSRVFFTAFGLGGGSILYRSDDRGMSWNTQLVSGDRGLPLNPASRIASSQTGQLFATDVIADRIQTVPPGGNAFKSYGDLLENIRGIFRAPGGQLYMCTDYKGLYRSILPVAAGKILQGVVYKDDDKNCLFSSGENLVSGALVEAVNGNERLFALSDRLGRYYLPLNSGNYALRVQSQTNYWLSCTETVDAASNDFSVEKTLGLQVQTTCPYLQVDVQAAFLRRCFSSNLFVNYHNAGTQTAQGAWIEVELDPFLDFKATTGPLTSRSGNTLRFDLGDVDINTGADFSIEVLVRCDAIPGQEHCVRAHIYPDSLCNAPSFAHIVQEAVCDGDRVRLRLHNDGNAGMTAPQNWYVIDPKQSNTSIATIASGSFQLSAGDRWETTAPARAHLLFVAAQDPSYPNAGPLQTEIVACGIQLPPGSPPVRISRLDEADPFESILCLNNRGSFDPNDIAGYPVGLTERKYIAKNQELEYLIRFQNTGTDTAFSVRIENPIRTDRFDLSSLVLGSTSHPCAMVVEPSGKLIFSFPGIQLPDSSVNEPGSHGFVQYRIRPAAQLKEGTQLLNDAQIFFDFNPGVNTNTDFHTLGLPIPVNVRPSDQNKHEQLFVAPNPAIGAAMLHFPGAVSGMLRVTDASGKIVWQFFTSGGESKLALPTLERGLYWVNFYANDGRAMRIAFSVHR